MINAFAAPSNFFQCLSSSHHKKASVISCQVSNYNTNANTWNNDYFLISNPVLIIPQVNNIHNVATYSPIQPILTVTCVFMYICYNLYSTSRYSRLHIEWI